jgi:hypothetical protein
MMRRSLSWRAALAALAVSLPLVAAGGSSAATPSAKGNPYVKVIGKPTIYRTASHRVAMVRINNTSGKVVSMTYSFAHYRHGKQVDEAIFAANGLVPPGISLIRDDGNSPAFDEARAVLTKVKPTKRTDPALDLHVQGAPTMDDKCQFSGTFANIGSKAVVHANLYFIAMRRAKIVSFGDSGVDNVAPGASAPASTLPATCAKPGDVMKAYVVLPDFF